VGGARVLVVDDNRTSRRVLQAVLTDWACVATGADDATRALASMREAADLGRPFDVALVDTTLPGVDGVELAGLVRADARLADVPVVLLTSSGQHADARAGREAVVAGHVTKPVRSAQLRIVLEALLGGVPAGPRPGAPGIRGAGAVDRSAATQELPLLVVEDNLVNQKVLRATLAKLGYRADVAANGYEALAALDRKRYAAVLMDCQMPHLDGYETTAILREREGHGRRTRVIAVTASALPQDRARCLSAGMDDYLTKPITAAALAEVLGHGAGEDPKPSRRAAAAAGPSS
jgi:CheY-like chemotaxis protein